MWRHEQRRPRTGPRQSKLTAGSIVDGRRSPIRPSRIGSIVWLIFDSSVAFSFTASIATIGALQYAIGLLHCSWDPAHALHLPGSIHTTTVPPRKAHSNHHLPYSRLPSYRSYFDFHSSTLSINAQLRAHHSQDRVLTYAPRVLGNIRLISR